MVQLNYNFIHAGNPMQSTTCELAWNHALWSVLNINSTKNTPHDQKMLSAMATSFSTWFHVILHHCRGWIILELTITMQNTSLSNACVAPVFPTSLRSIQSGSSGDIMCRLDAGTSVGHSRRPVHILLARVRLFLDIRFPMVCCLCLESVLPPTWYQNWKFFQCQWYA